MKKLIILLALISSQSFASGDVVDSFVNEAKRLDVENYQADDKSIEAARAAYHARMQVGEKEAKALADIEEHINSAAFQQQQAEWREQLSGAMGADAWKSEAELAGTTTGKEGAPLPYSGRAILFASSSVPLGTLRNYVADLEKINGVMVLRGFIGGMKEIAPTTKFINSLLLKNERCTTEPCERFSVPVLIDPILFKEYGITKAPAFTVHGLTNLAAYCNGTAALNPASAVVYGDTSIKSLAYSLYRETGETFHKEISVSL